MKALVTGGNGFLGSAIVRRLSEIGWEVAILCRKDYAHVAPHVTSAHRVDLRDPGGVRQACAGKDVVFHVAALTGIWGEMRDFESINVGGTRNVIEACRACGVEKLVYTSSPSVVFGGDELCNVNESQPYPARYLAAYPKTKAAAEREVLAANGADLATVALRPHLIWGPGDPHLIPRVLDRARKGKLRVIGTGSNLVDITYVDNAAEAHVRAARALAFGAPCAGRAYFVSQGKPVVLWAWLNEILQHLAIPPVTRRVSRRIASAVGLGLEILYRVLPIRGEPPMTRFVANQLSKSHYFDISAAHRDLGYVPTVSTDEGMLRLLEWLRRFPS